MPMKELGHAVAYTTSDPMIPAVSTLAIVLHSSTNGGLAEFHTS